MIILKFLHDMMCMEWFTLFLGAAASHDKEEEEYEVSIFVSFDAFHPSCKEGKSFHVQKKRITVSDCIYNL